jgi:hypothetical protein
VRALSIVVVVILLPGTLFYRPHFFLGTAIAANDDVNLSSPRFLAAAAGVEIIAAKKSNGNVLDILLQNHLYLQEMA